MKDVPHVLKELVRLALHATNEATRVAACKELLDRAIGKAVQPHAGEAGEGPVTIQVITGVPRAIESLPLVSGPVADPAGSATAPGAASLRHARGAAA